VKTYPWENGRGPMRWFRQNRGRARKVAALGLGLKGSLISITRERETNSAKSDGGRRRVTEVGEH